MPRPRLGFTLIELLVVISIISLLSSVVLASLQQARQKALAIKTVSDLKQIELALRLWADDGGRTTWWETGANYAKSHVCNETDWEIWCEYAVPISKLITQTNLGNYLTAAPTPLAGTNAKYHYRNDGASFACSQTNPGPWSGVTIHIASADENDRSRLRAHAKLLDQIIDGKIDFNCGRLRSSVDLNCGGGPGSCSASIYYGLGENLSDF